MRWASALALLALASMALAQQNPAKPAAPRGGLPGADQQQREQAQKQIQNQNPAQNQQQRITANKVATDGTAVTNNDHTIANWLAIGNQAEIAVAQAAAEKLENKDVRKFAEMLAKDHEQLQQHLQKFGAAPVRLTAHDRDRGPAQTRTSQQQQNAQQNPNAARPLNFLEINREIAERCVGTAQKELSEKQGVRRDECFVGMQIAGHQKMIDTGHVLRDYASPELQAVIDKAVETSESHLDQAKHLIHQLVGDKDRDSDKDRNDRSEK